jgi:hypothetical protein
MEYDLYADATHANVKRWLELTRNKIWLADVMKGWRRAVGLTVKQAAEVLDIPWRTLEGVEQGKGFRYPSLLVRTAMHLDKKTQQIVAKELAPTEEERQRDTDETHAWQVAFAATYRPEDDVDGQA